MAIKLTPIVAKPPSPAKYRKQLEKAADEMGAFLEQQFSLTTRTWSAENTPNWKPQKKYSRRKLTVTVASKKTDKVYFFVSAGTSVRRALMLPPFKSKTKPNRIKARKGQNSGVVVSKKFNLPGIDAREFDKQILPLAQRKLKKLGRNVSANLRRL